VCPSRLSTASSRARCDDTISKMEETDLVGERSRSGRKCDIDKGDQPMSICRQNGAAKFRQPKQISTTASLELNRAARPISSGGLAARFVAAGPPEISRRRR